MAKQSGGRAWSVPPSTFSEKVGQAVVKRQTDLTMAALEQIVLRAPIDTGRFLANNIVSVGEPVFYSVNRFDRDGHETLAAGQAALAALVPYSVTYIQNNLIYAGPLEDGHSGQAPSGVYGVSYYSVLAKYS